MWVDYTYYTETYSGSLLTAEDFNKYERKARNRIDYLTLSKASNAMNSTNESVKDKVKETTCEVAEMFKKLNEKITSNNEAINKAVEKGIASESVKSHSISFTKEGDFKTEQELNTQGLTDIDRVVYESLLTSGLMYRGLHV